MAINANLDLEPVKTDFSSWWVSGNSNICKL
jgi:hypothetical protein